MASTLNGCRPIYQGLLVADGFLTTHKLGRGNYYSNQTLYALLSNIPNPNKPGTPDKHRP